VTKFHLIFNSAAVDFADFSIVFHLRIIKSLDDFKQWGT